MKARTTQANQIRGLLAEFGIVIPQGLRAIAQRIPEILEDGENGLPGLMRQLIEQLTTNLKELGRQAEACEARIQAWHRDREASRRLAEIPGIGPLTASALMASIGDARSFANGRQLAAWLGLVPRQHSSGGKQTLLGIGKRGDAYLRTLLIHGARAVIRIAAHQTDHAEGWISRLLSRCSKNVAAVALANKNARIVWALLSHDRRFHADYTRSVAEA